MTSNDDDGNFNDEEIWCNEIFSNAEHLLRCSCHNLTRKDFLIISFCYNFLNLFQFMSQ